MGTLIFVKVITELVCSLSTTGYDSLSNVFSNSSEFVNPNHKIVLSRIVEVGHVDLVVID